MTLPALGAVRENFPKSSITVLAKPWVQPLFEDHPGVDGVMSLEKGEGVLAGLGEMIRVIRSIRKRRFDLAVLFQNAFEAALLTYLGRVTFRVGYNTDGRGLLLTHSVLRDNEVAKGHQVEYYLSLIRAMGWKETSPAPIVYVGKFNLEKAVKLLGSSGIKEGESLVGLGPGAIFGGSKRWPPERFAEIGDRAAEGWGAKILLFGSDKERDICRSVSDAMRHKPLNLGGLTSLGEAMGLISQCQFFVTNDSGLMHVAAALGVPTVAIFGSTDPLATGPRGPQSKVVRREVECGPCLKPECPSDHRCMLSIQVEEVWATMEELRGEVE